MATAPEIEKPRPGFRQPEVVGHNTEPVQTPELEDHLKAIEREPVPVDDGSGQPLLTPAQTQPTVTLPLSQEEIKAGLHHKIIDSVRWLAVFSLRIIKKAALLGIRIVYPARKTENPTAQKPNSP